MTVQTSWNIYRKELKTFFVSPIAYIVIVIFLVVVGWFFFSPFFLVGRADLRDFFSLLPIVLVFVIPAVTMRLFSEEFSIGSYEILSTLPVTHIDILLGKYFAALTFIVVMLLPTVSYPFFISNLGELDWGPVIGGYLGAIFLSGVYASIGIFASSITKNQIVAFIAAMAICFFFFFIDKALVLMPAFLANFLQFLGADYHFRNITKGIIDSRDIVYFLSISAAALTVTYIVIQEKQ